MDLAGLLPRSNDEKYLGFRDSERVEKLKPILIQLYMENYGPGGKRMTLRQITEFMRDKYAFHIAGNQLEYNLRKWNVRRRILSREKDDVINVLGKRVRTVANISDITLQEGKPVDAKQLKRHVQDKIRRHVVEPMAPGVLSAWNLPYLAFIRSIVGLPDMPSPVEDLAVAPSHITINSSKYPTAIPSQSMQLIRQRWVQDQSNLFLQGRFQELFQNCEGEDRIALVNYLYDFWIHTFAAAKYWTQGFQLLTKDMISAGAIASLTAPGSISRHVAEQSTPSVSASASVSYIKPSLRPAHYIKLSPRPAQYCRWIVHMSNEEMDLDPSQHAQPPSDLDEDPRAPTVRPSKDRADHPFTKMMQESLVESNFTSLPLDSLPISGSLISESLIKDSRSLQLEALKFAIIAGNLELVESILAEASVGQGVLEQFLEINPYHLAATYLDGGNTCCSILATLINRLGRQCPVPSNNEDIMGHTIFDCLIISVLRSHTNVMPGEVSSGFANMRKYPGEEKDTCGRWDADSPMIRRLFQRGSCRIPTSWKHPFCHSSVQAVCHNLMAIFLPGSYNPHIHQPSGLFIRHCGKCGTKLALGALHGTIVLAYYLGMFGIDGETLFGAVAILVCLLRLGADISYKTEVSIFEVLGFSSEDVCRHRYMDAYEFIETLATFDCSPECRIAWDCMRGILRLAKAGQISRVGKSPESKLKMRDSRDLPKKFFMKEDDEEECPLKSEHERWQFPCGNPQLGLVWAVVQAEMLTYRREFDAAPWVSHNFSMFALREWLQGDSEKLEMPLLKKGMLRETTPCGWIFNKNFPWSTAQCITKYKQVELYMNMRG